MLYIRGTVISISAALMSRKKVEMRAERNGRPEDRHTFLFAGGSQAPDAYVGAVKILATSVVARRWW